MYPNPRGDGMMEIGTEKLEAGDYLNYKRRNKLGQEVWSGCYVLEVSGDEVTFFNLREEMEVTHSRSELESALGETLVKTGEKWNER